MGIIPSYGSLIRGFSGTAGQSLSQPRLSHTFVAGFYFGENVPVGGLAKGISTGRLFTSLKSIEKPTFDMDVEKLRSYNSYYLVNKKVQYKDIQIVLYDDSTSYVEGLIKAYRAYYSYSGNKTNDKSDLTRYGLSARGASVTIEDGETGLETGATRTVLKAPEDESNMGSVPYGQRISNLASLGLRPQAVNFFEKIKIYDLGTEPNSINVYTLIQPKISNISKTPLNYANAEFMEVTITLSYEDFNEQIGVKLSDIISDDNFFTANNIPYYGGYETRDGTFETQSSITESIAETVGDETSVSNLLGGIPSEVTNLNSVLYEVSNNQTVSQAIKETVGNLNLEQVQPVQDFGNGNLELWKSQKPNFT